MSVAKLSPTDRQPRRVQLAGRRLRYAYPGIRIVGIYDDLGLGTGETALLRRYSLARQWPAHAYGVPAAGNAKDENFEIVVSRGGSEEAREREGEPKTTVWPNRGQVAAATAGAILSLTSSLDPLV